MEDGLLIRTEALSRHFMMGTRAPECGRALAGARAPEGARLRALDGVDIAIQTGEFLAVMGPSGSGKSTLLYLLGGLDRPTEGRIWVNGRDVAALDERALAAYRMQEIGFIFQAFHLIPTMTALENVMFPMVFAQTPEPARKARAQALLACMGLADRMDHKPTELSGGQQQRVAIARALANNPGIILADEPTGNLDSHSGAEIMGVLARLNREENRTIIIVSHDPNVTDFTTRVIHLKDGRQQSEMP